MKNDAGKKYKYTSKMNGDRMRVNSGASLLHEKFVKAKILKFKIVEDRSRTTQYSFKVDCTGYFAAFKKLKN